MYNFVFRLRLSYRTFFILKPIFIEEACSYKELGYRILKQFSPKKFLGKIQFRRDNALISCVLIDRS